MAPIIDVIIYLLWVLSIIIIAQAVLSWLIMFNVVNMRNDFVRSIYEAMSWLTEPLYRPIRRVLPDFGGLDFSPLVVLLLINVLTILLAGIGNPSPYGT
jgi:YggT family protein